MIQKIYIYVLAQDTSDGGGDPDGVEVSFSHTYIAARSKSEAYTLGQRMNIGDPKYPTLNDYCFRWGK